jgi:hypothetical protein
VAFHADVALDDATALYEKTPLEAAALEAALVTEAPGAAVDDDSPPTLAHEVGALTKDWVGAAYAERAELN